MSSLDGAVVALFEARMSAELAALVRRHGGEPYVVPAVRERPLAGGPELERALAKLSAGEFDIVVFLTGVGVRRLFEEARRSDCLEAAQSALTQLAVVCRGPKPIAALKAESIPVSYAVPSPHTTGELLAVLALCRWKGKMCSSYTPVNSCHSRPACSARGAPTSRNFNSISGNFPRSTLRISGNSCNTFF